MEALDDSGDLRLFYVVTLLSLYTALIPTLVTFVLNVCIRDSPLETSLKRQVSDLKEELGTISMVDEFAKYSKINRKLNKASDELKNKNQNQFIYFTKMKLLMYALLYGASTIFHIYMNYQYSGQPILHLPPNLIYPIGPVLSFPTGESNCISTLSWSIISGFVLKLFIQNIL